MAKTFINAYQSSSKHITHIYAENGEVHKEIVPFKPFLGYLAPKGEKTSWSDMFGRPVKVKVFPSIPAANAWKKENKDILEIYGDVKPVIQFIASEYRKEIPLDKTGMRIFNFDIEVFVEGGGFPKPEEAKHPINAITINEMVSNTYITFAYKEDYTPKSDNVKYIKCENEIDLLIKFLDYWKLQSPEIITGWNIDIFDIPYIINRVKKVISVEALKKFAPDGEIAVKTTTDTMGRVITKYRPKGIIVWDYMDLYKKYTQENREAYSLNHIAKVELGDEKIDYQEEYDTLNDLYLKNFELFIDYNIKDTGIVYDLDYQLDYINVAMSIMHKARCQPEDIFGTVQPWDCVIYNEMLDFKMLCPPNNNHTKVDYVGGWVEQPVPGLYEWLSVSDIVSSYPNNLISFNMSPETIIPDSLLTQELLDIREKYGRIETCVDIDRLKDVGPILRKYNYTFTSNGQFFDRSVEGILPRIFAKFFAQRKEWKKMVGVHKERGEDREAKIADLMQYTLKILLNSGYGAIANVHGRYFDVRIAEAITSNGQVCVRGTTKAVCDAFPIVNNVYNDTDSYFINCARLVEKRFGDKEVSREEKLEFVLKFNDQCITPANDDFFKRMSENMNMMRCTLKMEAECVADVSLFVAKKRYIMNNIWVEGKYYLDKPKRKIRGVEIVRSSTPQIVRDRLKEAVDIIFTTMSNDKLIEFIEKFRDEFNQMPVEKVAFPRSVTMKDYTRQSKGLPIGVNAALSYNDLLKNQGLDGKYLAIADGDKIKFTYIKKPNIVGSHVVGFVNKLPVELRECFEIDYNLQFQKAFLDPITKILESIGWTAEYVSSLEDFFA